MIKINLVAETPAASATQASRPQFSLGAKQGDIILLIVLALACVVVGTQWYLLSSKRADLRQLEQQRRRERDELLQYIKKVEELEARRESLRQKIEVIEELKRNQRGPVKIMDEVSRALPELSWLTRLSLKSNELVLEGVAMDENAVANFIANLDDSPFFEEPELKNLARARGDTFNFSLRCIFNIAPPALPAADGTQAPAAGQ